MAKIVRNQLGNFVIILLIFSMVTVWVFSGWPRIWQNPPVPPEIQEAKAADTTSRPNNDGTTGTFTSTAATYYTEIDDDPDSPTDTDYVTGPNKADDQMFVLLGDMPAGFGSATSVEIRARHRENGTGDDTIDIYYQIYESNETSAITSEVGSAAIGATFTTTGYNPTITGTNTKASWDGARIKIRQDYAKAAGPDTTSQAQISAVEVNITYTVIPTTISSAANQTFTVDDPATAIETITITDETGGNITDANDVRIKIPATFNMTWDETHTIATIGGGAAAKVSTTVSYEDSNKTLVLNVTENFTVSDSITVSGLSFKNFTAPSAADNLELEVDNAGTTAAYDDKTITITYPTKSFQDGVYPTSSYSGTSDTYINGTDTTTNYGTATPLLIDGDVPEAAGLIKWDVSGIPSGSVVQSVTITINVTDESDASYYLYEMKCNWVETEATWNIYSTENNWETGGAQGTNDKGSTILGTYAGHGLQTGSIDITLNSNGIAEVQDWVDNSSTNYGLIFVDYAETNGLQFTSREGTTASQRPKLTIEYTTGVSMSSAANQTFTVGDSATTIETITITDDATTPTITAADATGDIRIKIPSDFNMEWDISDTTATISGGAASKVSTTVSYEDSNKTLVIDVTTNFAASDQITVSGLSFKNFSATSDADNLELEIANDGSTACYDGKTITITSAVWTAYNDLAGGSTGNVTNYTSITGETSAGYLKDYETGDTLDAYLDVVVDTTLRPDGIMPNAGTDAYNIFNGKVDAAKHVSYTTTPHVFTFTGLDPDKTYKFVHLGNRDNDTYTSRIAKVTISDVDSAENASSIGIPEADRTGYNTIYCTGYNTVNGYVAAWTNINPGADGDFVVSVNESVAGNQGTYSNVIMLEQLVAAGVSISSAANQSFTVGDSATAIETITITDDATTPPITAADDIRIKIPSTFNMIWDETDTTATIGGGAAGKVSTTVSYEDSNKTLVIDVTTNFATSDSITVSGLSFKNFSAASVADNLELEVLNDGNTQAYDDKTITIVPSAGAWTAYNDCGNFGNIATYGSLGNVTNIGADDSYPPNSGTLIKYSDGTDTLVTLAISGTSVTQGTGCDTSHGNPSYPPSGDAATEFGTIINMGGISYATTGAANYMTVTLSGVLSSHTYTLVVLGMRGVSSYVRDSKYVISGIDSGFTNVSSSGTTISTTTMTDDTTTYATGDNWDAGLVAKWASIVPTSTSIVVTITPVDTVDDKGYLSAIKLIDHGVAVPAGATIGFICDGRPGIFPTDGAAQLTVDLNQLDNQMAAGWSLDAVATIGDMDDVSTGSQTFDGAYASSDVSALPVFFTPGNHEITDDNFQDTRNKYSTYPAWNLQPGPTNGTTTTYSFDKEEIHVAVINEYYTGASDTGGDATVVDALFDWLKTDLRNSTQPYKIIVGHEPAYPVKRHVGTSLDQYPSNRDRFWNLLQTERVIGYFTGHDHNYHFTEHDGVYEVDGGVSGGMVGGTDYDNFATLLYAHYDAGSFVIRAVNEGAANWGGTPTVTTKSRSDLDYQILVNTAERAGTESRYFVDDTASNPDWTGNNGSRWWEGAFNDTTASWSDGELCAGFDTGGAWPWMNTTVSSGIYGVFQRISFTTYDKASYNKLYLGVDYDDAVTVWLNGTEIYKSTESPTVGTDDIWDKTASAEHTAAGDGANNPSYTTIDVTGYIDNLNEGSNLLTVGNWNYATADADLAAGIKLYLKKVPVPSISSAANQTFNVGQSTTAIETIAITENPSTTTITAANDIRVKIPSGFNMIWDYTDTIATIGGGAASKVSTSTSYEDSNKTLVIDVTSDFATSDQITISDLSFTNFTATSSADNMELETANDGSTAATDDKAITIQIGAPSLSFSITNPTVGFGTWSGIEKRWATSDGNGATDTQPSTEYLTKLSASTNAESGLTITIRSTGNGSNPGLYSSAAATLIPAAGPNSITGGTAGYAAYGANDTGGLAGKIESDFAVGETTATLLITAQSFVTATAPVSSGSSVDLVLIAAVASSTPAGTYSDTLTLICTGNF